MRHLLDLHRVRQFTNLGCATFGLLDSPRVRQFTSLGCVTFRMAAFTSGVSVYQSWVRHLLDSPRVRQFTSLGCVTLLGCVSLRASGASLFEWRHLPRVRQFTSPAKLDILFPVLLRQLSYIMNGTPPRARGAAPRARP